jgi:hypothetical protein
MFYEMRSRMKSPFGAEILEADPQSHKLVLGVGSLTHWGNCWIETEYELVPLVLEREGWLHPFCWQQIYRVTDPDWDVISVRVHWYDRDNELWVEFVV